MTTEHPITPPPELVREWSKGCSPYDVPADHIATQAARWGFDQRTAWDAEWLEAQLQRARDQELEACCEVLGERDYVGSGVCGAYLRAARRPKPPSLKLRIAEAIAKGDKPVALSLLDEALPDD